MDLGVTKNVTPLLEAVRDYIDTAVLPVETEFYEEINVGDRWELTDRQLEILHTLKEGAKAKGLWNFFLTEGDHSAELTTVEYAYLAEEMGRSHLAAEIFNCAAPEM